VNNQNPCPMLLLPLSHHPTSSSYTPMHPLLASIPTVPWHCPSTYLHSDRIPSLPYIDLCHPLLQSHMASSPRLSYSSTSHPTWHRACRTPGQAAHPSTDHGETCRKSYRHSQHASVQRDLYVSYDSYDSHHPVVIPLPIMMLVRGCAVADPSLSNTSDIEW